MKYFTLILACFPLYSSPGEPSLPASPPQNRKMDEGQKPLFSAPVWMIEQELVKLGKNEAYVTAKKDWLAKFEKQSSPETPFMVAAEESGSNQYLYLFPLQSISGADDLRKKYRAFRRAVPAGDRLVQEQLLDSLVNVRVRSLHEYKEELSYASGSFLSTPHIHYTVYSLAPGTEEAFEQCLIRNVAEAFQKKEPTPWRVWKMIFGGDVPKYVVCFFAASKEALNIPDIIEPGLEMAIRKKQEGDAVLVPGLSLTIADR